MKYLVVIFSIFIFTSCVNDKCDGIPCCVQNKIQELKSNEVQNPPGVVIEYVWGEEKVYYISKGCCDQFDDIIDSDCNYICARTGGFSGGGDGKCPEDFILTNERILWKDNR